MMLWPIYDSPMSMGYILDRNVLEKRDTRVFLLLNQVLDLVNSEKGSNSMLEASKGKLQPLELFKS